MTALTFPHDGLRGLLAYARNAWPQGLRPSYGQEEPLEPGFWLVGDRGIYLMHNGAPLPAMDEQPVVYARECDPHEMPAEEWVLVKEDTFGGDDGVEFIAADTIEQIIEAGCDLEIRFLDDRFEIVAKPP